MRIEIRSPDAEELIKLLLQKHFRQIEIESVSYSEYRGITIEGEHIIKKIGGLPILASYPPSTPIIPVPRVPNEDGSYDDDIPF